MIYTLLIHDSHPEATPRSDDGAILERHRAMQADAVDREQLLAAARLDGRPAARTVRPSGDGFAVTDGPYMETKEWLVGFYLVECDDEAAALARAERICPPGGSVEVRPASWHRVPERIA